MQTALMSQLMPPFKHDGMPAVIEVVIDLLRSLVRDFVKNMQYFPGTKNVVAAF